MEPTERRAQGAHYTTEKNILKVIEPPFLDDLRAEFRRLQARRDGRAVADLRRFRDKLGSLRLFDPACGCSNFLIIAYRELRTLEIDVLRETAARVKAMPLALNRVRARPSALRMAPGLRIQDDCPTGCPARCYAAGHKRVAPFPDTTSGVVSRTVDHIEKRSMPPRPVALVGVPSGDALIHPPGRTTRAPSGRARPPRASRRAACRARIRNWCNSSYRAGC